MREVLVKKHDFPRETFIALRARREAYHVATDFLYDEPIDVNSIICHACGNVIDPKQTLITEPLTCPSCGMQLDLPAHMRGRFGYGPSDERDPQEEPVAARVVRWYEVEVPPWIVWLAFFGLFVWAMFIAQYF